ncbi:MAG: UvrD-helicase domain-containing protein, partial [Candidatus Eremiobacterota bacterium]
IALKAGAGSGKTRVLSKRFFKLLKEVPSLKLDSIVAITFTRKASIEMKERIRKEIHKEIEREHERQERDRWKKLRDLITTANIDTIHGFCSSIIKDNFASEGIDPSFSVMEGMDADVNLYKFAEEAILEYVKNDKNDPVLKDIYDNYGIKTIMPEDFRKEIVQIYLSLRGKVDSPKRSELIINTPQGSLTSMAEDILISLHNKYEEFKKKKNLLDFNDLEICAERILQKPEIKKKYFDRFKYFLVDEVQDVNPIQQRILSSLTEEDEKIPAGRLFIVGDSKQSIYGFRGTDYRIFEDLCRKISENGEEKKLLNCYRSTSNIVDTVNIIFQPLIDHFEKLKIPDEILKKGKEVELITWKKDEIIDENKERWKKVSELLPLDDRGEELKRELKSFKIQKNSASKKDYQGSIIAGRVKQLLAEGFDYKDIAILLRARTNLKSIEHALYKSGIPYCVLGGIGFWEEEEINDIISFYRFIFNRSDMISFLTILRSPVTGFSDDMIFKLMEKYKDSEHVSPVECLKNYDEHATGHEKALSQRALYIFTECLKIKGSLNAYELVKRFCRKINYGEILLSLPNGEQKYRNFEKFLTIVMDFEKKNIYSPRELPMYLEMFRENRGMDEEAFLDTEDSNAVKILTIHASKGLEFRAVIIPDMDSSVRKDKPLFYYDKDKGIIAIGHNKKGEKDEKANPLYYEIYNKKIEKELDDSKRIFYVASTRAKEFLAFAGEDLPLPGKNGVVLKNFMLQLNYALKDKCITSMKRIDGKSFIREIDHTCAKEPSITENSFTGIDSEEELNLIKGCEHSPSGNLSISRYLRYLTCQRLYYFQNILSLDESVWNDELSIEEDKKSGTDGAIKGSVIHDILARVHSSSPDKISEKTFNVIEKELFRAEKIYNISSSELRKYTDNYIIIENELKKRRNGKYLKSLYEYKFLVPLEGNLMLSGVADRVDFYEHNGKVEVFLIEYKTDRIINDEKLREKTAYYKKQIYAYIYGLEKIPFIEDVKTEINMSLIYFLHRGESVEIQKDCREIEELKREMVNSSEMMLGKKGFEAYMAGDCKACSWCDYKSLCEKSGGKSVNKDLYF